MQNRSINEQPSSSSLDYLSIVSSLCRRFPSFEHDEALSIGYEVMIRAHRTFLRLHGASDCSGYVYTAVQNAFKRACGQRAKEDAMSVSLEKFISDLEKRGGVLDEVFYDSHNIQENWEFYEQIISFVKHLDEGNRVIFLFRWAYPDISLERTAQILSSLYPHLYIPKKQPGLTKRLQKIRALYSVYMSSDEVCKEGSCV